MAQHRALTGQSIALVAVFAAFIAAASQVSITIGVVPITLQTFAVVLAALVLGPWRALGAVTLYLVMGAVGVPVFANHVGGLAILTGPTGGFLVGFLSAAVVVGALAQLLARTGRLARRGAATAWLIGAGLVSIPVVYAIGAPWLAVRLGWPLLPPETCAGLFDKDCVSGLTVGVVPFVPFDIIKVIVAGVVAAAIHRAYPGLLGSARRATGASSRDDEDEAAHATA
ncbi:biotin transporter BioY [Demequina iriomotensis]|uniref:biotin transporter BioY n=1 Tax=Demequina iriomotensis TaxID=1536641 RepID=UPI0007857456|nr:biotin transporter BioY [Demequina iriomotensis]